MPELPAAVVVPLTLGIWARIKLGDRYVLTLVIVPVDNPDWYKLVVSGEGRGSRPLNLLPFPGVGSALSPDIWH